MKQKQSEMKIQSVLPKLLSTCIILWSIE